MTETAALLDLLAAGTPAAQRPWPRYRVSRELWHVLIGRLAETDWSLLGLWGEAEEVHAALMDEASATIAVASMTAPTPHLFSIRASSLR